MLFHRNFNEVSFYENTFLHFSLCRFHSRNHQKREKVDIGSEKITMLSVSVLLLYLLKIELKILFKFFFWLMEAGPDFSIRTLLWGSRILDRLFIFSFRIVCFAQENQNIIQF